MQCFPNPNCQDIRPTTLTPSLTPYTFNPQQIKPTPPHSFLPPRHCVPLPANTKHLHFGCFLFLSSSARHFPCFPVPPFLPVSFPHIFTPPIVFQKNHWLPKYKINFLWAKDNIEKSNDKVQFSIEFDVFVMFLLNKLGTSISGRNWP